MIQVNLIPDVKLELVKAQRHRNVIIAVSVIVAAAAGVFLTMILLWILSQQLQLSSSTSEIEKAHKKFMNIPDIQETVTISNQLANIDSSHEKKAITSRIFDVIIASSMQGSGSSVAVSSFNIDTASKSITIVAQTERSGYDGVDVFVKNLEAIKMFYVDADPEDIPNALRSDKLTERKDEKSELIADNVAVFESAYTESTGGERVISFRVSFDYSDLLFSDTVDLLRLEGLDMGNVTDSYQRLPESLFTEAATKEVN